MSEKHYYTADKLLFRYLRARPIRQLLRKHGMRLMLGLGGAVEVWSQFGRPHFQIELSAYSTGRVYMSLRYRRECTAESFEAVPSLLIELASLARTPALELQPTWRYGNWMPEQRTPADLTPVQRAARERRAARYAAWLAKQPAVVPQPPPVLSDYVPRPLDPAFAAASDKIIQEMIAEEDAKFLASINAVFGNPGEASK